VAVRALTCTDAADRVATPPPPTWVRAPRGSATRPLACPGVRARVGPARSRRCGPVAGRDAVVPGGGCPPGGAGAATRGCAPGARGWA